jgi:hypothetical protein
LRVAGALGIIFGRFFIGDLLARRLWQEERNFDWGVTPMRKEQNPPMKVVAEYLANAAHFERLAKAEKDLELKKRLLGQAQAYWKLADKRADQLNQPRPTRPPQSG